jgi:hypothetical protein
VSFELRYVFPSYTYVLYSFIGVNFILPESEVHQRLQDAGVADEGLKKILDLLVWFGFLGIMTNDEEAELYSYEFQYRVDRMVLGVKTAPRYVIHPAFRVALGCLS